MNFKIFLVEIYLQLILFGFIFFPICQLKQKAVSVWGKVFQIVTRSRKYGSKAETDTASKSLNTKSTSASITIANIITAIININHIRFVRWWWRHRRRIARLSRASTASPSMILNESPIFPINKMNNAIAASFWCQKIFFPSHWKVLRLHLAAEETNDWFHDWTLSLSLKWTNETHSPKRSRPSPFVYSIEIILWKVHINFHLVLNSGQ